MALYRQVTAITWTNVDRDDCMLPYCGTELGHTDLTRNDLFFIVSISNHKSYKRGFEYNIHLLQFSLFPFVTGKLKEQFTNKTLFLLENIR